MNDDKKNHSPDLEIEKMGKFPNFNQKDEKIDIVETFSKGLEEDLRRILGDKFRERPSSSK